MLTGLSYTLYHNVTGKYIIYGLASHTRKLDNDTKTWQEIDVGKRYSTVILTPGKYPNIITLHHTHRKYIQELRYLRSSSSYIRI